jgi:uncharacterized protein involved in outer membrane biogenesis
MVMKAWRITVAVLAILVVVPLALLGCTVLLVQSDWGARWLGAQASERIHREVRVEGIRVAWEWPPAIRFERVRIANPDWARTPALIDASGLYAQFEPWPLFDRRLVVPSMVASRAEMGLEIDGEKATWHFGDEQGKPSRIELTRAALEEGHVVFRNDRENTAIDAQVKGSVGQSGEMHVDAKGKFRGEAAKFVARLPGLQPSASQPFRFGAKGSVGRTEVVADGTAAGKELENLDFNLTATGPSLKHIGRLTGVVLPDTPPYRLKGHLKRNGGEWVFDPFDGKVGDSDLAGSATYRKAAARPFLLANLRSKRLDFNDLGPLVGAPPGTGPGETASAEQRQKAAALDASAKILPRTRFETERWDDMDADVKLVADKVLRPQRLPIDTLKAHLLLKSGVVTLDPLDFGFAGGHVTSVVKLDGNPRPMHGDIKADVQNVQFARLFPTLKTMDEALGTFYGRARLAGRGNSIRDMLGTSSGDMTLAANGGQVSQLLTELLEIDVAKALMLLGARSKQVELRCAVGHLNVKDGVATPEDFIIDTTQTYVSVGGRIDLANERLDIETHAKGKGPSLLTLRSPIVMEGPLKSPKIHPKAGPVITQTGIAGALAAVNPALAVAPFVTLGSGKDADCTTLLSEARKEGAVKKAG